MPNVARVLWDVEVPPAPLLPAGSSSFELFAGYLVFDALVLNRDRHAANWSVLRRRDGSEPDVLCPLYDNASSLGMAQAESTMRRRLQSRGVDAYVGREGWARPFAGLRDRTPTLFDVAAEALALCSRGLRAHWLERVNGLRESEVWALVDRIPEMSDVVRTFTVDVVMTTRGRLLDVRDC